MMWIAAATRARGSSTMPSATAQAPHGAAAGRAGPTGLQVMEGGTSHAALAGASVQLAVTGRDITHRGL
ncbi:hypothetical protein ACI2L1_35055 [Streptomyces sp. NPDC019531]|uniref:hypothetical protein n=1 Tax=Streptomyces sp. NPDC019531 TaxID=3365062 RepID=UPI00384EC861